MFTLTHYQPHHGPHGERYRVRARFDDRTDRRLLLDAPASVTRPR
jgi:hypothetical protein